NPSSRECRKGIHCVVERSLVHHVMHREVLLVEKVEGKPSESEVQRVRGTKRAHGRRPERALSENINCANSICGTGRFFRAWHLSYPCGQPSKTEQSYPDEDGPPAVIGHEQSRAKRSRRRPEFHASNDGAIRKPAGMLRQMLC